MPRGTLGVKLQFGGALVGQEHGSKLDAALAREHNLATHATRTREALLDPYHFGLDTSSVPCAVTFFVVTVTTVFHFGFFVVRVGVGSVDIAAIINIYVRRSPASRVQPT